MKNITDVIKKVSPSVVSIVVTKDLPKVDGFYNMPLGGRNFVVPKFKKGEKEEVKIGSGSGFVVSENGIVLTNSHVVQDVNAEYTAFFDQEHDVKHTMFVVARDPLHDIAICKIDSDHEKTFPSLELGNSTNVELGEYVIAVGNALGEFSNTVSLGIISGLSRFIQAQGDAQTRQAERLRGLIQTDAAINPGNSGGPLINMNGEVIGINTAVVFGAQSIGFSIPINQAKADIAEVKKHGRIRLPFLGVRYIILDKNIQEQNKLPVDYGALIMRETLGETAVLPNSSAAHAGLEEFDIILEADGKKITPETTLQDIISERTIGDTIPMKVRRGEDELELTVELEEKKQ
ncbi:MAG: trypsin-like peptidase domain-containing protein [Candidatus Spechtbacterales bacterium]